MFVNLTPRRGTGTTRQALEASAGPRHRIASHSHPLCSAALLACVSDVRRTPCGSEVSLKTRPAADMHTPDTPDPLRDAVTAAVRVLGLYHVASEAGVTHQTLRRYLDGSSMRAGTIAKLNGWATLSRGAASATGTAYRVVGASWPPAGVIHGSGG